MSNLNHDSIGRMYAATNRNSFLFSSLDFIRILILGHRGLVGSNLVKYFKSKSDKYLVFTTDINLENKDEYLRVLDSINPDVVICAAAKVGGIQGNLDNPIEMLLGNLRLQDSVFSANAQRRINRFIFLGSTCIYPANKTIPMAECDLLTGPLEKSNELYALAKICGAKLINQYRLLGYNWTTVMPCNLYGPGDNYRPDGHVMAMLIRRFVEAVESGVKEVTIWGDGTPRREFLHVDDLASAIEALIPVDTISIANVSPGVDITISELANLIAAAAGYTGKINYDTSKPNGTHRKLTDPAVIESIGWEPKINLKKGVALTIEDYIINRSKYRH